MSNEINEQEILQWVRFAKGMNESLADVLRHDEGHDKWHAMNGDAPCTSEADCAKKRAKYDEVKSEVAKGDVLGHEFHGNQHTTHSGRLEKEHANMREALSLTRAEMAKPSPDYHGTVADDDHMWDTSTGMKDAHRELGHHHRHEARLAREAGKSDEAHQKAASLHEKAYKEALKYNHQTSWDGDYLDGNPSANEKIRLSERLLDKSEAAHAATRAAEGVNKSAAILKGDVLGHEFHGNQHTDGGVGAAKELQSETENLRVGMDRGEDFPSGDNHREFATTHDRLATSAPTPELREGHKEAADLHREAAKLQDISAEHKGYGDSSERADEASYDALRASKYATDSTIDSASPPTPPTPVDPNETF
jgi:hypothetical protein